MLLIVDAVVVRLILVVHLLLLHNFGVFYSLGAVHVNFHIHITCFESCVVTEASRCFRYKFNDVVEMVQLSLDYDLVVECDNHIRLLGILIANDRFCSKR